MKRMLFVFTVLTYGCGDDNGTPANTPDAMDIDAQGSDAGDHGAPSTMYPAFAPDKPIIGNNGGLVLTQPKIVTISWSSDPHAADFEAFGDAIGASNYWHLINSEYGVGPAVSGAANHVRITTPPPATMNGGSLENLIITNAGNAASGWPAPTSQTIYSVFPDPTTVFQAGGQDECMAGVGGYHSEASAASVRFQYSVQFQCRGYLDAIVSASHEYDEAATDPRPQSSPGWVGFDNDHIGYDVLIASVVGNPADEVGDACEISNTNFYHDNEPTLMYDVQRQWSNASVMAGHNPCVPNPPTPYYGVVVLDPLDAIATNLRSLGLPAVTSKGFKVPAGQTKTFQIGFYSDKPTSGPWTVTATVPSMISGVANGQATVSIDKTTGVNGEKAYVTVSPSSFSGGVVYIDIASKLQGYETHHLPLLIGAN